MDFSITVSGLNDSEVEISAIRAQALAANVNKSIVGDSFCADIHASGLSEINKQRLFDK